MVTSVTVNGTTYYFEELFGGIYCSTEKIQGEPRQLMIFNIQKELWNGSMLLPIPNDNLIVLEQIIRATMM